MFIALLPAVILGAFFGRIWASFYDLEGKRYQPRVELGAFLSVGLMNVMTLVLLYALAVDFAPPETLRKWRWVLDALPYMYAPSIQGIAWISAHMYRRKLESKHRHRLQAIARARAAGKRLGVQETPQEPGASELG